MRHRNAPPPARGGRLLATLLTPLALAACSQGEERDSPAPTPSLTTQAAPTTGAAGEPLTEGQWFIGETATAATAEFGPSQGEPLLRLVCDRDSGALTLIHMGQDDEAQVYTIEVGGQRAGVQMSPSLTGVPAMLAEVDPGQPIFAAFANPGETIEIGAAGGTVLRLPGNTGVGRVMEACR